ncbi:MAG: hypothetical protein LUH36_04915, partial [Oscillospiraceae bacterium]|nr:hypothetical protein [Oscillospiraceae bacterium]
MSHKTPDDDFDLPNFDGLMDGDTQGGNTEKDDAWADADPDQVDAVLSALNHQGGEPAGSKKPAGQRSAPRKKEQEPDAFQVNAVLAA